MRTRINHYIPCTCGHGCLQVDGIEIDADEGGVSIRNLHVYGVASTGGFWKRIKNAWTILLGGSILGDDAVLSKDGVIAMKNACEDILKRWPEYEMIESGNLDEIYHTMVDEEAGKKLRGEVG